ncbi:MAG: hypothetical protein KBA33_10965 [Cloacibacterium sp.]|nr:hypothetical protein [Cloacibacterium sp.]
MVNKIGLLFFLIPFLSFSQIKPKIVYTDLQRMNLKGNVKEVFETDLKIENNQITESKKTQFYQFFLNGRLKSKENFLVETVTSFNYDQKGRITSERTNHKSEKKYNYPKDSVAITLNKSGDYNSVTKSVFKESNEIEIYKTLDFTEFKQIYTYDSKDRIIKSLGLHYYPDKVDTIEISSTYRRKCLNPVSQAFDKPFFKNVLNKKCDIILHQAINKDGTIIREYVYTYIYDKKKNWIERRTFLEGQHVKSTKREIKYY